MNRTLLNAQRGNVITFVERPGVEFQISEKDVGRGASCIVYHAVGSDHTEHLLKEYYPKHLDLSRDSSGQIVVPDDKANVYEQGLVRFRDGCERQKAIRLSNEGLKNFTCNVQGYYQANGTEYIDMTCFNGHTYDHAQEKSVYELMLRMRTLAQVVGNYHKAGLLHLDIKPENIYVRPEGETIEDVMLFDFDSVTPIDELCTTKALSCTKTWAAPEQLLPEKRRSICPATDLFAIGEIIFVQLFGRHSTSAERRSFVTRYEYNHKAPIFKDMNPKVFPLLDNLLCHTICGVVGKRYQSAAELIVALDEIIAVSAPEVPFLKKTIPYVQDPFVGREKELESIHSLLSAQSTIFLSGIGGIGKSELAKQYAKKYSDFYDTITLISFTEDLSTTIQAAENCPYNVKQSRNEKPEDYFKHKVEELQKLSTPDTLIIVDNFDVKDDPNVNVLFDLGAKVLVTTRSDFSDSSYSQLSVNALENPFEVFYKHYPKPLTESERIAVNEIVDIICGHTLTVELLAKQMMAGRVKPDKMLAKLQGGGISESSKEKVRHANREDGNLIARSAYEHIKALFDLSNLDENERYILANLSLIPRTGISTEVFHAWCELEDYDGINELVREGWIRLDDEQDCISVHPVIADILQCEISSLDIHKLSKHFSEELTDENTGEVILSAVPFSFANSLATKILKQIQQKHIEPTEEMARCVAKFGEFFFEQDLFELSEKSYCLAQEVYKCLNIHDAYFELETTNNLALLYDKQGNLFGKQELSEKALRYFIECLEIAEDSENNLIEYAGTLYGNIGSVYHTLNDYANAELFYKKALETSDRYSFRTNIGVLYENMGDYLKALEMHREAMEKAVEHNEPELVIALIEHNLAVSYKRLGSLNDATTHCESALRIRERKLNSEVSYDLALSKSLLGQIYTETGALTLLPEAERLLNEALLSLEKIVGSAHEEYQKALVILNSFSKKV